MKLPKSNRIVGAVKTVPLWFRPLIKTDVTRPEDWFVVKLSGNRTGYIEAKIFEQIYTRHKNRGIMGL